MSIHDNLILLRVNEKTVSCEIISDREQLTRKEKIIKSVLTVSVEPLFPWNFFEVWKRKCTYWEITLKLPVLCGFLVSSFGNCCCILEVLNLFFQEEIIQSDYSPLSWSLCSGRSWIISYKGNIISIISEQNLHFCIHITPSTKKNTQNLHTSLTKKNEKLIFKTTWVDWGPYFYHNSNKAANSFKHLKNPTIFPVPLQEVNHIYLSKWSFKVCLHSSYLPSKKQNGNALHGNPQK